MKYPGTVTGRWGCDEIPFIDYVKTPNPYQLKPQQKTIWLNIDYKEIERRLIRTMALTRLQWLTLWDDTREYFRRSNRVIRWDKEQIIAKMDELERNFIRRQEKEDRDYGSSLD